MRFLIELVFPVLVAFGLICLLTYSLAAYDCQARFSGTGIPSRVSGIACQVQIDGIWRPAEMVFRVEK